MKQLNMSYRQRNLKPFHPRQVLHRCGAVHVKWAALQSAADRCPMSKAPPPPLVLPDGCIRRSSRDESIKSPRAHREQGMASFVTVINAGSLAAHKNWYGDRGSPDAVHISTENILPLEDLSLQFKEVTQHWQTCAVKNCVILLTSLDLAFLVF